MPLYKCNICDIQTNIKSHHFRHLKTQKHITNEQEMATKNKNILKMNPIESKMNPNESKMNPNESKMDSKKYKCQNCNKLYSTSSNLRKHQKKCLQNKSEKSNSLIEAFEKLELAHQQQLQLQQEQINKMELEKEELRKQIEVLIEKVGDTTNITQNNNIVLNCYGNEDLSYITDQFKTQLLKIPYGMIPKMIEAVHFNKQHPQNTNIVLPNKKEPYVKVYSDQKWIYKDKKETVKDLVDKNYHILDSFYEETGKDILEKNQNTRYIKFQEKMDQEEKVLEKKINQDVDIILLNH